MLYAVGTPVIRATEEGKFKHQNTLNVIIDFMIIKTKLPVGQYDIHFMVN